MSERFDVFVLFQRVDRKIISFLISFFTLTLELNFAWIWFLKWNVTLIFSLRLCLHFVVAEFKEHSFNFLFSNNISKPLAIHIILFFETNTVRPRNIPYYKFCKYQISMKVGINEMYVIYYFILLYAKAFRIVNISPCTCDSNLFCSMKGQKKKRHVVCCWSKKQLHVF